MATTNAITFSFSLSFSGLSIPNPPGWSATDLQFNVTGSTIVGNILSVLTSATVIPLGSVTTPHWAVFQNLDPTNYITIFNGASGAVLARLLGASAGAGPYGDVAVIPLDPTCVPYAKADTAACLMQYLIASA